MRRIQYLTPEDTLGVDADDTFWLKTSTTKARTGTLVAGTHAELERLLLAAGFPNERKIPAGSARRALFYRDASVTLAWPGELAEHRALFAALDSVVLAAREGVADPAGPSNAPMRLSSKQRTKLDDALACGRALIGLPDPSAPPKDVARGVAVVVDRLRAEKTGDDPTFIALGVVFGDALARATGWPWRMIAAVPVLLPENRAHVLYPIAFVVSQVRDARAPTLMLLFDMIASGQLPPSKDGALTELR